MTYKYRFSYATVKPKLEAYQSLLALLFQLKDPDPHIIEDRIIEADHHLSPAEVKLIWASLAAEPGFVRISSYDLIGATLYPCD